jgi:hypothetical protein
MNACILFILFNGSAYVTPACFTPHGDMYEPQDVVYVRHLPESYINVVYESPTHYVRHYRPQRRHVSHWRSYQPRHRHHVRRHHRRHHRRHVRPHVRNMRHRALSRVHRRSRLRGHRTHRRNHRRHHRQHRRNRF